MAKESEFLSAIREADKINKQEREEYFNKYEMFAKEVSSGKYKIQGEEN